MALSKPTQFGIGAVIGGAVAFLILSAPDEGVLEYVYVDKVVAALPERDHPIWIGEIDRVADVIARHGDRFLNKIYTRTGDRGETALFGGGRVPKSNVRVEAYGTVVFEYKGRTERVTSSEEQQLSNALIKLITGGLRVGVWAFLP